MADYIKVSAKIDLKPIVADLQESLSPKQYRKVSRAVVTSLAKSGASWVRKRMGGLTSRTGWLKKHIYGHRRSDTHSVVAPPMFYGEFLEKGVSIRHKRITGHRHHLHFKGPDGRWTKAKTLTIPPKKWFAPSIEGFEESDNYTRAITRTVDFLLAKFEKVPEWQGRPE